MAVAKSGAYALPKSVSVEGGGEGSIGGGDESVPGASGGTQWEAVVKEG